MATQQAPSQLFRSPAAIQEHLQSSTRERLERAIKEGMFPRAHSQEIAEKRLPTAHSWAGLTDEERQLFLQACNRWEVMLLPPVVRSHRRFIGPVIVFVKKLFVRILSPLLEPSIRRQREFNATMIETMLLVAGARK